MQCTFIKHVEKTLHSLYHRHKLFASHFKSPPSCASLLHKAQHNLVHTCDWFSLPKFVYSEHGPALTFFALTVLYVQQRFLDKVTRPVCKPLSLMIVLL